MGIRGARSLLDADPNRFAETIRYNYADDDDSKGKNESKEEEIIFLVDAMALLYHVVVRAEEMVHASPATVRECVSSYIWKLVQVAGKNGAVHVFLDGLSPIQKMPTQISRMQQQAFSGDLLARGETAHSSAKVLHLLAEWSLVEAIDGLMKHPLCAGILFMYRASQGEGEAYIDHWIERYSSEDHHATERLAILSDDTDFLIYPHCPGFVPFSTVRFEEQAGKLCMQGQHFLCSKFLKANLPAVSSDSSEINIKKVMSTIAFLAGCDYVLEKELESTVKYFRKFIVASDIGGLRLKHRNNPTAASTLTAVFRFVNYHIKKAEDGKWIKSLISEMSSERQKLLTYAFDTVHKIYFNTLVVPQFPTSADLSPGSVDVKRLFQYGVFYCYPVIETWKKHSQINLQAPRKVPRKRSLQESCQTPGVNYCEVVESPAYAVVTCPPFTRQVAAWASRNTVWFMPHFRQIRTRLYCLVRLVIASGRKSIEEITFNEIWTADHPYVKEIVRSGLGKSISMDEKLVGIPDHEFVSAGLRTKQLLRGDRFAMDRALLFCVLGNPKQAGSAEKQPARRYGTLFLASLTLPFNLACLLILMGTAPTLDVVPQPSCAEACSEVNQVLPLLSVACYHALLLVNTVTTLFGDCTDDPGNDAEDYSGSLFDGPKSLASQGLVVSDTIRHDNALLIWQALRLGDNLEELGSDDMCGHADLGKIKQYLNDTFLQLAGLQQNDLSWGKKIVEWKRNTTSLWLVWWEMFNVDYTEKPVPLQ